MVILLYLAVFYFYFVSFIFRLMEKGLFHRAERDRKKKDKDKDKSKKKKDKEAANSDQEIKVSNC